MRIVRPRSTPPPSGAPPCPACTRCGYSRRGGARRPRRFRLGDPGGRTVRLASCDAESRSRRGPGPGTPCGAAGRRLRGTRASTCCARSAAAPSPPRTGTRRRHLVATGRRRPGLAPSFRAPTCCGKTARGRLQENRLTLWVQLGSLLWTDPGVHPSGSIMKVKHHPDLSLFTQQTYTEVSLLTSVLMNKTSTSPAFRGLPR
jgi:hypothetical protein